MIVTRAQLESLSQDELTDRLLSVKNISIYQEITNLINQFDKLMSKYEELYSELVVSKNVNKLLKNRVVQLEKNALNTSQYIRRKIMEINPVHTWISYNVLEKKVCDSLSLTGILFKQEDLHTCHRMKDQSKFILKFKDRNLNKIRNKDRNQRQVIKYCVTNNWKKLAKNENVVTRIWQWVVHNWKYVLWKSTAIQQTSQAKTIEENSIVLLL